jgi:hypothetical protein
MKRTHDDSPLTRRAYLLGVEECKDYIEAECDWVKEDVADGNDGYYQVRQSDIEALTRLSEVKKQVV